MARADPSEMRLLIATDNHLGIYEEDEVRKHDSFTTFEEILVYAQNYKVDALLLGGDLFHDNKPSRPTVVRTINLLRKYVMSDTPVSIEVLSDQATNFSQNKRVNYEEENYNVGLPIFIIHGNHDEPAGSDNLSAIDILAACNLVNYYGKTGMSGAGTGRVEIAPVLIQKGESRLALYGLGYMRDARLYRMMTTSGDVTWRRPADSAGLPSDSWFNLFFIHQNHAPRGAKNNISERQLPGFLDLVVWGHEHASKTEPTPSTEGSFEVSQPGSSVATTLSEDEAIPKQIMLLSLKGADWKTENLPLRTVRPFVFRSVVLAAEENLKGRPEDGDAVARHLASLVEEAIAATATEAAAAAGTAGPASSTEVIPLRPPVLPLVRLRIDHSGGFPTVPLQRFGAAFVKRVANPWDLLQFHKAALKRERAAGEAGPSRMGAGAGEEEEELVGADPQATEHRRIDALVAQNLPATLQILGEAELAAALEEFVQRDEKNALVDAVTKSLKESQKRAAALVGAYEDDKAFGQAINDAVHDFKAKKAAAGPATAHAAAPMEEDEAGPSTKAAKPRAAAAAAPSKEAAKQTSIKTALGRAAEAPARKPPPRRAAAAPKSYAEGGEADAVDDDEEDDFGPAAVKRAAAEAAAEEEEEDEIEEVEAPAKKRKAPEPAKPKAARKPAAPAAKKARGAAVEEVVLDSDEELVQPKPSRAPPATLPPASLSSQPPGSAAVRGGWGSLRK